MRRSGGVCRGLISCVHVAGAKRFLYMLLLKENRSIRMLQSSNSWLKAPISNRQSWMARAHNLHRSADLVGYGRLANELGHRRLFGDNARTERIQQRSPPSTLGKCQYERVGT